MLRLLFFIICIALFLSCGLVFLLAKLVVVQDTAPLVAAHSQNPNVPVRFSTHNKKPQKKSVLVSQKFIKKLPTFPKKREITEDLTKLIAFEKSAFPYEGLVPESKKVFLNYEKDGRKARKTPSGRIYWADETYNDQRVLLHIPKSFDIEKPAMIVLFFHGHLAKLQRDHIKRQRLPEQISNSGANVVLVAPQLAVNARDSSPGNFWKAGMAKTFLDETSDQLAKIHGGFNAKKVFSNLPVVLIGYSGGFLPTASVLSHGKLGKRIQGVVLLDGLYNKLDVFASWIEKNRSGFFLSAYTRLTERRNEALMKKLEDKDIEIDIDLEDRIHDGQAIFIKSEEDHWNFVSQAWVKNPVQDLLSKLKGQLPNVAFVQ